MRSLTQILEHGINTDSIRIVSSKIDFSIEIELYQYWKQNLLF